MRKKYTVEAGDHKGSVLVNGREYYFAEFVSGQIHHDYRTAYYSDEVHRAVWNERDSQENAFGPGY